MTAVPQERGCDYCGLPVTGGWLFARKRPIAVVPTAPEPLYCCLGCRLAADITRSRGEEGAANWTLVRLGLALFFTLNVMVFTMALWSQDVYGVGPDGVVPLADALAELFRWLCLIFAIPVLLLLGVPMAGSAWSALRGGTPTADLLIVVGVAASYAFSAVSVIRESGHVYFEVGCMVLILVTLGRWIEATGRWRAGVALAALDSLLPERVRLVADGIERSVSSRSVRAGDCVRVLPGERFAADGEIIRGRASIDEHVFTGESQPVVKQSGDAVTGGTTNIDGDVLVKLSTATGEGGLRRLVDLVREARNSKGRYQRLADRAAVWFLPAVIAVAAATLVYHTASVGIERGMLAALAVLLVACPCALGLATPMAVWSALGTASEAQVLFKNAESLERLATIRAVRFDKTGTLTESDLQVRGLAAARDEHDEVLRRSAALASATTHPSAGAICDFAGHHHLASDLADAHTVAGKGVTARQVSDGAELVLGSPEFLSETGLELPADLASEITAAGANGDAVTCIGWDGAVRGVFRFRERLRGEAEGALGRLIDLDLDVAVLTGDRSVRAAQMARRLGVTVHSGLSPEAKLDFVRRAQQEIGPTAVVGDGINDAPALAASDLGVSLACGTDVSRDSADVCLLGNDLSRLPWAITLARRTVRVIRQNLAWAFGYNAVAILLAASGLLNPIFAALAMAASSLFVVCNSLRLREITKEDSHESRDSNRQDDSPRATACSQAVLLSSIGEGTASNEAVAHSHGTQVAPAVSATNVK